MQKLYRLTTGSPIRLGQKSVHYSAGRGFHDGDIIKADLDDKGDEIWRRFWNCGDLVEKESGMSVKDLHPPKPAETTKPTGDVPTPIVVNDLGKLSRAELDELLLEHEMDPEVCSNMGECIEVLTAEAARIAEEEAE